MCLEWNKEPVDDILYNSLPSWIHNTCGITWSEVLQTPYFKCKDVGIKNGTYFFMFRIWCSSTLVRCRSQRDRDLCIPCPGFSSAPPAVWPNPVWRREEGGRGRQEMICHPWFVTMLHQIPFSCLPSLWFQVSAEHPQSSSNWTGWELILTQRKVWAVFASTSLRCYGNHLYFLQYLFTWVIELFVLRVVSTNCTRPFTVFPSIWLYNSLPTDLDRLLILPHNNKHWPLPA